MKPNLVAIAHDNYSKAIKECNYHELLRLRAEIKEAVRLSVEERQLEYDFWLRFWKERKENPHL